MKELFNTYFYFFFYFYFSNKVKREFVCIMYKPIREQQNINT